MCLRSKGCNGCRIVKPVVTREHVNTQERLTTCPTQHAPATAMGLQVENETPGLLGVSIPSSCEIVRVRQRFYLVEEVVRSRRKSDSTLVRLSCIEDDAQGQRDLGCGFPRTLRRMRRVIEELDSTAAIRERVAISPKSWCDANADKLVY